MRPEQNYTHSFPRFFELEGEVYDRIKLIEKFGIVSPKMAEELKIPYKRRPFKIDGIPEYDDMIFLFPEGQERNNPNEITVFINGIEIVTPEDMAKRYGSWPAFSRGEVYTFGRINRENIRFTK